MHPDGASHRAEPPPPFPMPPPPYHAVPMALPPPPPVIPVRRVWDFNFDPEMQFLGNFAVNARYAAVSIHYPGVLPSHGPAVATADQRYGAMKANVDGRKPIQVGLAVYNDYGHIAAWEFNLRGFDPAVDPHTHDSVTYLQHRGLRFRDHNESGVALARLAAGLNSCGLIRRPGVSWSTYAGSYHVAYLMKILFAGNNGGANGNNVLLPYNLTGFLDVVRERLGDDVYDVARMAVEVGLPPGLERVAAALCLLPAALSPSLAGAGSMLVLQAFMRLKYDRFGGDVSRFRGLIHGIQVV
ncbi:unnamed protein product [Urochloa decumbens]|uniref:Uncharacterized protein n=1 Tax=Urochloa decumbens TaxID=240449 RepID=A0ABC9EAH3_9POAL